MLARYGSWFCWARWFAIAGSIVLFALGAQAQSVSTKTPAAAPAQAQEPTKVPGFTGVWKLNTEQSDDPKERLKNNSESSDRANDRGGRSRGQGNPGGGYPGGGYPGGGYPGGGYPGGRRGGMGIPGMGRGGGGGRDRGQRGQPDKNANDQAAKIENLIRPSTALRITRNDPEIDVSDTESVRQLFTDGRKLDEAKEGAARVQQAAHWDGNRLVVEEKAPGDAKVTRVFALSEDGKQLVETITVEPKSGSSTTVRYVYDPSGE